MRLRKGWTERPDTRLRKEPDHAAEVLRLLPARTEVEILEEGRRFTKVRYVDNFFDQTGYVATVMLEIEPGPAPDQAPEPDPRFAHLLPCQRCGGQSWGIFNLQQSGGHVFHIPLGFLNGAAVRARVCLRCGYLELSVDEDDLNELARKAREDALER